MAKKKNTQNIVIGGASGALPPVIGWAIATGSVSIEPIVLFLIILFGHHLTFGLLVYLNQMIIKRPIFLCYLLHQA